MEELIVDIKKLNEFEEDNHVVPKPIHLVNPNSVKKCLNLSFLYCSVHLCLSVMGVDSKVQTDIVVVNVGENTTLPCRLDMLDSEFSSSLLSWRHPGKINKTGAIVIKDSGALYLHETNPSDAGIYSCVAGDQVLSRVELQVYDVPSRISDLVVTTNSVYSIVSWRAPYDGGYPIHGYICQHKLDSSLLHPPQERSKYSEKRLAPDSRTCDLYGLVPNTTYLVRVAAYNKLGAGEYHSKVTTTKPEVTQLHNLSLEEDQDGYGRVLAMSIAVSVLALATLGSGIALLLIKHRGQVQSIRPLQESPGEEESLELVPHITLNPSFNIDMLEHCAPDGNGNSEHAFLVGSPVGRER